MASIPTSSEGHDPRDSSHGFVASIYSQVMNDVMDGVRSELQDQGLYGSEEQEILDEIKMKWQEKLIRMRAANYVGGLKVSEAVPTRNGQPAMESTAQHGTGGGSRHYDESGNYLAGSSLAFYPRPGAMAPVGVKSTTLSPPTHSAATPVPGGFHPLLMNRAAAFTAPIASSPTPSAIKQEPDARPSAAQLAHIAMQHRQLEKQKEALGAAETSSLAGSPALSASDASTSSRVRRRSSDPFGSPTNAESEEQKRERQEQKRRRILSGHDDAINSDLDDTDEEEGVTIKVNEMEWDPKANLMLCTYEKVSRVKNKWKCAFKDGVLTLNGKDYLFHRAQCDFEW